ncbi:MAG: histidinol-phosphate transaminase [Candidatus Dormibacteria bacterium]
MSRFRKPSLAGFEPYVAGIQPPDDEAWVKLNTNESPRPPSPAVLEAVNRAAASLRLYPDPSQRDLRAALAEAYGLQPAQVMAGNGGDEVLAMAVRAFVPCGGRAAYLEPSYSLIPPLLQVNDVEGECHRFDDRFLLPRAFIESDAPLKFLCNPNSPTGTLLELGVVEEVCATSSGVILLDEAYVDFAPRTGLEILHRHPNLMLLRSMSKSYALAGLRVGFCMGSAELVADVAAVKDDYNLNRLQLAAAAAAVRDPGHWREAISQVVTDRDWLTAELRRRGWGVLDSHANFVFAAPPQPARAVYSMLLDRHVLVRFFDRPGVDHGLRISVGTREQCQALLEALDSAP